MTHLVGSEGAGLRLVDYCKQHLVTVPIREVGDLIAGGHVTINGEVGRIAEELESGDELHVFAGALTELSARQRLIPPSPAGTVRLVGESELFIVVDKPHDLHVHPMGRHRDRTVIGALATLAGASPTSPWAAWRPHAVHRLDRATSGYMAVAKNRSAADAFQTSMQAGAVSRTYVARVVGNLEQDTGTVSVPLGVDPGMPYRRGEVAEHDGGKEATTHFRVLGRDLGGDLESTVVELRLETGRTHQIRAHMSWLGHPIVGDRLYGTDVSGETPGAMATSRIALRAVSLELPMGADDVATRFADDAGDLRV